MKKLSIAIVVASLFLASCSATNFLHKVKNKVMGTPATNVTAPAAPADTMMKAPAPTTAAPADTMMKADVKVDTTVQK